MTILHIGDSHVQADGFTSEIRDRMQKAFGYGGRGMVFPYSTARTHAAVDYTTWHTGRWIYARNIEMAPPLDLGVSGIASKTFDSNASFKLRFQNTIRPEFKKLRIFCKRSRNSYDLVVKTARDEVKVDVYDEQKDEKNTANVVDVELNSGENEYTFYLKKTDTAQREFEIYGISIENPADQGVLFHSVGINGAGFNALLRQNLTEEQLRYLAPDAIILDVGANDFYRGGMNKWDFVANLKKTVEMLRRYDKDVPIILSCSQDIYRGGYSVPECATFSDIVHEFSKDYGTAFYDWYWIAGGHYSMLKWNSSLLSSRDLVHLSAQGYKLKGQMIAEAYEKTYNWFLEHDTASSNIYNIDSLAHPPIDSNALKNTRVVIQYRWVYHRVQRGQTVSGIAAYYGVTSQQIKAWNHLRSNYLWIGQLLKIYAPFRVSVPVVNTPVQSPVQNPIIKKDTVQKEQPKPPVQELPKEKPKPPVQQPINNPVVPKPKPPAVVQNKPVYHTVRAGETLFSIAKRYNTSTSAIMQLNRLRSTNIKTGQVLRVK